MLTYRQGDADQPRGHALLFFRDADDADVVWATYLVVAPIALDLGKYLPAAFAGQIPASASQMGPTAYPLPPMPEKVPGGLTWLERMANLRGDDLLDGGMVRVSDPWQVMGPIAEVGRQYAEQFAAYAESDVPLPAPEVESELSSPAARGASIDVDDLLLQVMPDREKVGKLARLTGSLRYAVEGGDDAQAHETVAEMDRIGRHLGEKYRVSELIAAARSSEGRMGQLAQLYVERAYKLADEDYAVLPDIERRITELRAG